MLISYNGGVNFYLGNNAGYPETLEARPGWEWEELVGRPLRAGVVRPSQRSTFFYGLVLDYVRESPWDYLGLQVRKLAQFWHGDEIKRNQEIYYWRRYSTVLTLSLWKSGGFPFWTGRPLGAFGHSASLAPRPDPVARPLCCCLRFGGERFFCCLALPAADRPLVIALGGLRGDWLYRRRRLGGWRAGVSIAVLAVLLAAANWGIAPMDMRGRAATFNDLGNAYLRQGRAGLALPEYERAVRRDSTYWQAVFNLASLRAMRGDTADALPALLRVSEQHPERADVWSNLAGAYVGQGDKAGAIWALEQSVRRARPHAGVYAELVGLYMEIGAIAKADAMCRQALRDFPDDGRLRSFFRAINR